MLNQQRGEFEREKQEKMNIPYRYLKEQYTGGG